MFITFSHFSLLFLSHSCMKLSLAPANGRASPHLEETESSGESQLELPSEYLGAHRKSVSYKVIKNGVEKASKASLGRRCDHDRPTRIQQFGHKLWHPRRDTCYPGGPRGTRQIGWTVGSQRQRYQRPTTTFHYASLISQSPKSRQVKPGNKQ